MTAEEKRTIALHEAGHATLSWFLAHANPLIKVTIVPVSYTHLEFVPKSVYINLECLPLHDAKILS